MSHTVRESDGPEIGQSVLRTLAYADIFEYPLRLSELHRYLVGVSISQSGLEEWLQRPVGSATPFERKGEHYFVEGRSGIVDTRHRRREIAARLWPKAYRYSRIIGRIPFVRMIGVTGGLSVDNVDARDDIDFFVVTEPGRLWLCRALIVALVRIVDTTGVSLCPNFLVTRNALEFSEHDLFTAHELMQMVPMIGKGTYDGLRRLNRWADALLPNASGPPEKSPPTIPDSSQSSSLGERLLSSGAGERFERWEMDRKVHRFSRQVDAGEETGFHADWCKGHFGGHRTRTINAYLSRLRDLGIPAAEHEVQPAVVVSGRTGREHVESAPVRVREVPA